MTQERALSILQTGANVFLTGEPGSGKTYTLNRYLAYLAKRGVAAAVTASTGIAATHIGGVTIHSWSGIGARDRLTAYELDKIASTEHVARRVRKASVLVIDEISMLSSETLSMVDSVCREVRRQALPFGGLQTVFVGDFFQLPPVVGREIGKGAQFAYASPSWERAKPVVCYLSEQHRHDDAQFFQLLSSIRNGTLDDELGSSFEDRRVSANDVPDGVPKLYSHNADVDQVNERMLSAVPGAPRSFSMHSSGAPALVAALKRGCLSPETLTLKIGAVVMCTKNNQRDGVVNGTLGEVVGFERGTGDPRVKTRKGRIVSFSHAEWTIEEGGKVKARIAQIPLRLAWAITVHKSQGMSLSAAAVDLSRVFEYGQGYVALSRVRRLDGLYLLGWNVRAGMVHPDVRAFDKHARGLSEETDAGFAAMPHETLCKLHENFIIANGGSRAAKPRVDTHEETRIRWEAGMNVAEIARERSLAETTIFGHIEYLAQKKKITPDSLRRLLPPDLERVLPEIRVAFAASGDTKLAPVFERLAGRFSYDDLRIARFFLE